MRIMRKEALKFAKMEKKREKKFTFQKNKNKLFSP